MKGKAVLALAISLAVTCASAARSPSESAVAALFASLEGAVNRKSPSDIRACYSDGDPLQLEKVAANYADWIENNKGLRCSLRVVRVRTEGVSAEAAVLRRLTYTRNDRPFLQADWLLVNLRQEGGGWVIQDERPWAFSRTAMTELEVQILPEQKLMKGAAVLDVALLDGPVDALPLDLNRGLKVSELRCNGSPADFEQEGCAVLIRRKGGFEKGGTYKLNIRYEGSLFNENQELGGCPGAVDAGASFGSWLSVWYPRVNSGSWRSPGKLTFAVPEGLTVASNGKRVEEKVSRGRKTVVFSVAQPSDFTFAAAKFFRTEKVVDGIDVGVFFLAENKAKAEDYIDQISRVIKFLKNDLYGMYPYECYRLVELPNGAMGNSGGGSEQGLGLYPSASVPDDSFDLPIYCHEIGHCYWGNYVPGDEVVMSEGLANLTYALCTERLWGEEAMRRMLKYGSIRYFQAAYLYFARIAGREGKDLKIGLNRWDKVNELHALSNTKGFFAFLMLREVVGEQAFLAGLCGALAAYPHKPMKLKELQVEWEKASGQDLRWFFDQWFYRSGAPEFAGEFRVEPSGKEAVVSGVIRQRGETYRAVLEVESEGEGRKDVHRLTVDGTETPFSFRVPFRPEKVTLDPSYKVFRWTGEFRKMAPSGEAWDAWFADDSEKCLTLYEEQLRAIPDHVLTHAWMAFVCWYLRQYDRCLTHCEAALAHGDARGDYEMYLPDMFLLAGRIADIRGERQKAQDLYRRLLAQDRIGSYRRLAEKYLETPYKAPTK